MFFCHRRMMLNSCNNRHHHYRHQHDHHPHDHHHHHDPLCPGPGTQVNSLVDAVNSTNCLNMVHLKASFSSSNSKRKNNFSVNSSDDLEAGVSSTNNGNRDHHHHHLRQHQTPVSVYYEEESFQKPKPNSFTEGQSCPKPSSSAVENISDKEETSFGEIEAELQEALKSMQQEQEKQNFTSGRTMTSNRANISKSAFFEIFFQKIVKGQRSSPPTNLNRSSSMFVFGKTGNSGNSRKITVKSHTGGHNSKTENSFEKSRASLEMTERKLNCLKL